MTTPHLLSAASKSTAGILLLSIVFIEYGGWFMLRLVRGRHAATPFQHAFARAGHAHAGVLVILGLVAQLLVDGGGVDGVLGLLGREAIPIAAILVPAGFFFSSAPRDATRPNGFIALLYAGMVALGVGVVSLGVGLLTA